MTGAHPLQLRDLDGYRFVAACRCGYKAVIDPAAVIAADPDARYWTQGELAARLSCSRCRKRLIAPDEEVTGALVRRRLALERPARAMLGFQGGMVLPSAPPRRR
ncbi:hypothetical protein F1654_00770 [Alkalicaulis satelles]|uniref:Uncharacterized protein n=1 Tax=Alkalicaulis satelles TaxID=2609175 RepID=A0A5M6ZKT1_9PROT|nr:hypothetical protein [Alkalicaulis satelles]KAA5804575.1 hypothetical protein F1654_00770 [Alkalicaulis satelles]